MEQYDIKICENCTFDQKCDFSNFERLFAIHLTENLIFTLVTAVVMKTVSSVALTRKLLDIIHGAILLLK